MPSLSRMFRITSRVLCAFGVMASAACSNDTGTGPGTGTGDAQLAILNALSLGDATVLKFDGGVVNLPSPGQSTGFAIPTGVHNLEARGAGNVLLASVSFTVGAGSRRSAVISGAAGGLVALLVAADTASLPPLNAAKVRVVHMASGAPPLDAYLSLASASPTDSAARFVSPFSYGTGTNAQFPGYAVRPIGTYRVWVAAPGTTAPIAEVTIALGDGQVWSVVLSRDNAGTLVLTPVREGGQELR